MDSPAIDYRAIYSEVFGRSRDSGRCVGFSTWIDETFADDIAGKDALDVGCGKGELLIRLEARGAIVRGFDVGNYVIYDEVVNAVDTGYGDHLPYPDKRFALVFSSHVLEHIYVSELPAAIKELFRVAREQVVIAVGLADCPEHLTVMPWAEWVEWINPIARAADFVCIRAAQQALTYYNLLVFKRRELCTEKEFTPKALKDTY